MMKYLFLLLIFISCSNEPSAKYQERQYLKTLPREEQLKYLFGEDTISASYGRAVRLLERDGNLDRY